MQQAIERLSTMLDTPEAKARGADFGDMKVTHMQFARGVDITPLLQGMPDDLCPCPHWGYLIRGRARLRYADGREEVTEAGQVYYWPPGHTVLFEEETEYVEFSPRQAMDRVLAHVGRKMQTGS